MSCRAKGENIGARPLLLSKWLIVTICLVLNGESRVTIYGRYREVGFTLIEVMIVVAIVSVVVGLALPNYLQWVDRSNLRQVTSNIATQLTMARVAGMNRNRSVDVTVDHYNGTGRISAVTTTGTSVFNDLVQINDAYVIGSPVTVSYNGRGLRTSGGTGIQTIGVCNRNKLQYSVTIMPNGKVNWSLDPSAMPCP